MLIVIFLVCMVLTIIDEQKWYTDIVSTLGIIVAFISLVAIFIVGAIVAGGMVIDEKIELYETTNAQIDEQVREMVTNYKDYESETFSKIKEQNAETLVTLFPELKSDELVKTQMEIYMANKQQILELKEEKINLKPAKWWLYFGG